MPDTPPEEAAPDAAEQRPDGAPRNDSGQLPEGAPQERYGIIDLARLRKADGRQLILYSHRDRPAEDGEQA
jgi:hypothetical protein